MASNSLNPSTIVERLTEPGFVKENAFEIVRAACLLARQQAQQEAFHDLILRLLEHRSSLGTSATVLDALVREVGLFPFLDPNELGLSDRLAYEFHRPDNLDVVFHRPQAQIYRLLMDGRNVVLSAPTSFGKSLIIDAIIASRKFNNLLVIVPTIALIDETRRRIVKSGLPYKVITHSSQKRAQRNVFVMTQERVLELDDVGMIDFFVIDEFYKLAEGGEDRAALLNQALYKLLKKGKQFYMLGPHVEGLTQGLDSRLKCEFRYEPLSTVVSELHRVTPGADELKTLTELCKSISGQTLIFCSSPQRAAEVSSAMIAAGITHSSNDDMRDAVAWLGQNYHPHWHVTKAIANGIGVHHGRIPRALAQYMVRSFNSGRLNWLVCTSTLIEGVNTKAQNIIILDNKINNARYDYFTFNNIRGRSGRMFQHFVGHVYVLHDPPQMKLPLVDIPAFTQTKTAPDSLLIQLEPSDLTDTSTKRVQRYQDNQVVSYKTLQLNNGVDPEQQINFAKHVSDNLASLHLSLAWRGLPSYDQLQVICRLMFDFFNGSRLGSGSAVSAKQLALLINRLKKIPSTKEMIKDRLTQQGTDVDRAVSLALDFNRLWAMFHFPKLLRAMDALQRDVFASHGLSHGDYTLFAAKVENLFLDPSLIALDEYGIPIEVAQKLTRVLKPNSDLDEALARLKVFDVSSARNLDPFERAIVADAQQFM